MRTSEKTIGLISKTTTLPVHHAFLFISLLFLHDYDVKMSNFVFYGELSRASNDEILFRFLNLNKEGSRTFDKVSRNKRPSRCCRVVGS